jgi:hypothetical protein
MIGNRMNQEKRTEGLTLDSDEDWLQMCIKPGFLVAQGETYSYDPGHGHLDIASESS